MTSDQKLTDEAVIQMREEVRSGHGKLQRDYADLYGVTREMIAKAIRGQTFKHLNKDHPPVKTDISKLHLKDEVLRLYKAGNSYNAIVAQLDISKTTVAAYCRHLRQNTPDLKIENKIDKRFVDNTEKKIKAQQMYLDGYTHQDIAKELNISTSSVNSYCKPVVGQERKERLKPKTENYKPAQIMTRQDVIDMRNQVRETGVRNLRYYSEKYGVNAASISYAISGKTFKYLNDICPPVTEKLPIYCPHRGTRKKKGLPEDLIQEIIRLRKEDPVKWTYGEIARYVSQKVDKKYIATHISKLLINRDPSLKELEAIKPPPKPKVYREPSFKKERVPRPPRIRREKKKKTVSQYHEHECVVCENKFKSLDPDAEVCWRKECIAVIESYSEEHEDA